MSNQVCELAKNAREKIIFRLGEFKGHKFIDMRVFAIEDGKDPAPTKKGLAVSPALWLQFKEALAQGDINPGKEQALTTMLEAYRRGLELTELEARIRALEKR